MRTIPMRTITRAAVLVMLITIPGSRGVEGGGTVAPDATRRQSTVSRGHDAREIVDHIRSIFEAYLRKDREALRRTHAADWVGFLGPSVSIERGIEAYMRGAERSLRSFDGTGYELLDTEVQIHGDLGIVYYTARYDYRDGDGAPRSMPLRSVDIYRRIAAGWIQAGSHIVPVPSGGRWGEGAAPDPQ